VRGGMFSADGVVTSLLKTPFSQMCYAVNTAPIFSAKLKDEIISQATESNEHCKETLKKFGILAITDQIRKQFLLVAEETNKFDNASKIPNLSTQSKM
jgi:hypothetical protein